MGITNLVLIGRTGNGKSATANSILGRERFISRISFKSVTKQCEYDDRKWKDGRTIRVIDTPGLFDTDARRNFIEKEIARCVDIAMDGVHSFVLVLSIRNRFTEEEANAFEKLQVLFGPKILDYMTIVFTCADLLPQNGYIALHDYLQDTPSNLQKLMRRLDGRVVEFDNVTTSETKKDLQITKLLQTVDKTVAENGGGPYTNELFENAKTMTSQVYYIKDKELLYQDQINQLREMMTKNAQEMKEKILAEQKRIEEAIKSAGFSDEIAKLRKDLADARKQLQHIKEIEDGRCCNGCSIM